MNVSFIIASNRPPNVVDRAIESINAIPKHGTWEILLYSPSPSNVKENVVWFKEEVERGPHYGFNFLVNRAKGEFISQLTDDQIILGNFWEAISLLESGVFKRRKYKVTTLNTIHHPVCCGWPHPDGFQIPNHLAFRFPVVHRSTINEAFQGYFYHPELISKQADAFMGFWCGEMGESGIESTGVTVPHIGLMNPKYLEEDTATYFDLIRTFYAGNKLYVRNGSRNEL